MTSQIQIRLKNQSTLFVNSEDSGIMQELWEFFSFFAPGYQWMPSFKNKLWDGKLRLLNLRTRELPSGLYPHLLKFIETRNYMFEFIGEIPYINRSADLIRIVDFIKALPLNGNRGEVIEPHDYQIDAVQTGITKNRSLLISPTGSGKSLIIYILLRWFLQNRKSDKEKAIIVVPTTSLVEQLYKDFQAYSQNDPTFDTEKSVHQIYSGKEKFTSHEVIITTWQSAITMSPIWFKDFSAVFGDEAHLFKAQSLTKIMNMLGSAWFRIGTTGTIDPKSQVNKLILEGAFGLAHQVTSTKELMDRGTLAQLQIYALVMKYSERVRKEFGTNKTYQEEIDFIVSNTSRNNFISNLALDISGNTLLLFNYVERHGKVLYELIKKKSEKKNIYFISGAVGVDERERIREIIEKEKDAILIASVGTCSVGLNIRNLHNIIFASPTKSQIRVLQSIGRGLRKSDDGRGTTLYDLTDDISWKKNKNYSLEHGRDRAKIYIKERFKLKIVELELS